MKKLGLTRTERTPIQKQQFYQRRKRLDYVRDAKANNVPVLPESTRTRIADLYDGMLREELYAGKTVKVWTGLGYLQVVKKEVKVTTKSGKLKKQIAFGRSVKRNLRDEDGKLIYIYKDFEMYGIRLFWYGLGKDMRGRYIKEHKEFIKDIYRDNSIDYDNVDLSKYPTRNDHKNFLIQNGIIKSKPRFQRQSDQQEG